MCRFFSRGIPKGSKPFVGGAGASPASSLSSRRRRRRKKIAYEVIYALCLDYSIIRHRPVIFCKSWTNKVHHSIYRERIFVCLATAHHIRPDNLHKLCRKNLRGVLLT